MPSPDHYVIIGNGPAGNHAASELRTKYPDTRITIISDENAFFYYKHKLTDFIADRIDLETLRVDKEQFLEQKNVKIRLGQTVEKIDPDSKSVFLKHMEKISYSKLLIASGSCARVLPSMKNFENYLQFITGYTDVMENKEKIQKSRDFFVFGGDLFGFKFLKMLNEMNKKVTVLIHPDAFWPYSLTKEMLDQILKTLSRLQADVIIEDDISAIEREKASYVVKTVKGSVKKADMVFSFNGLIPRVDFARGSGLEIDQGILVDENLRTSIDDIYACGSCAQIYNPSVQSYTTSIGWPNAVVHGRIAALNMMGEYKKVQFAGRKYFDLEGVKIKTSWWEDIR